MNIVIDSQLYKVVYKEFVESKSGKKHVFIVAETGVEEKNLMPNIEVGDMLFTQKDTYLALDPLITSDVSRSCYIGAATARDGDIRDICIGDISAIWRQGGKIWGC